MINVAFLKQLQVVSGDVSSASFLFPMIPSPFPGHPKRRRGRTPFGEASMQSHITHADQGCEEHPSLPGFARQRGQFSPASPQTPSGCASGCTAAGCVPACRWSAAGVSAPRCHPGSPRAPGPGAATPASGSATCPTAAWPPLPPGSCSRGAGEREGKGITQGRLSKGGGQQQGTPAKATPGLGEEMHIHPDEDRMRSLPLKTLPMVSVQDSSVRNGSK